MGVPFVATIAVIISSANAGSAISGAICNGFSRDIMQKRVEMKNVTVWRIRN